MIQTVIANLSSTVKRRELNGRKYLVSPVVLITEGVFNGAGGGGPVFYPEKELSRAASVWNHKPIVVGHPTPLGNSAYTPEELNKRGVGMLMNVNWDKTKKKLRGEAWFEVDRLNAVDSRLENCLVYGRISEVSTGLGGDLKPEAGEYNGKSYHAQVLNHRPDHLAVLFDTKGACSVDDGAGLNQLNQQEVQQTVVKEIGAYMTKKDKVDKIIANAENDWAEADRDFLMNMEDPRLEKLMPKAPKPGQTATITDPSMTQPQPNPAPNPNPNPAPPQTPTPENPAPQTPTPAPTAVANQEVKPLITGVPQTPAAPTVDQWLANSGMPPELQEQMMAGIRLANQQKEQYVNVILANKANTFTKEWLQTQKLEFLQATAALAQAASASFPNYAGQAAVPMLNQGQQTNSAAPEPLGLPILEFKKVKAS